MPHSVVLRFDGVVPVNAKRILMHAQRRGGDVDHCDLSRSADTVCFDETGEDFSKRLRDKIKDIAEVNLKNNLEALALLGRNKDRKKRAELGLIDPYRASKYGPVREAILTANQTYFLADDDDPDPYIAHKTTELGDRIEVRLSRETIAQFREKGREFFEKYFPEQVLHLRLDMDEEVPHFHAVLFITKEVVSQRRGKQVMLQPSANPLIASYEHAQDVAGDFFKDIGLQRGERSAQARRDAKEQGQVPPDKRSHTKAQAYRDNRAENITIREARLVKRERLLDQREAVLEVRERESIAAEKSIIARANEEAAELIESAQNMHATVDAQLAAIEAKSDDLISVVEKDGVEEIVFSDHATSEQKQSILERISRSAPAALKIVKLVSKRVQEILERAENRAKVLVRNAEAREDTARRNQVSTTSQLTAVMGILNETLEFDETQLPGKQFSAADGASVDRAAELIDNINEAPYAGATAVEFIVPKINALSEKHTKIDAQLATIEAIEKDFYAYDADKKKLSPTRHAHANVHLANKLIKKMQPARDLAIETASNITRQIDAKVALKVEEEKNILDRKMAAVEASSAVIEGLKENIIKYKGSSRNKKFSVRFWANQKKGDELLERINQDVEAAEEMANHLRTYDEQTRKAKDLAQDERDEALKIRRKADDERKDLDSEKIILMNLQNELIEKWNRASTKEIRADNREQKLRTASAHIVDKFIPIACKYIPRNQQIEFKNEVSNSVDHGHEILRSLNRDRDANQR